jgi:hypothetical protein
MSSPGERLRHFNPLRKLVYFIVGLVSYPGLAIVNKLTIPGTEHIKKLPHNNVLFVSNHQTYFADVIAFLHIFCAVKWGKKDRLGIPYYLLNPFTRVNYVAAEETMKELDQPAICHGRCIDGETYLACGGREVRRGLDPRIPGRSPALKEIGDHLPQGTTKPFAQEEKERL